MKYTITGTEVIRIEEKFGVIQNLSCSVAVELSSRADFVDSWILYPLNVFTFNARLYVRAPAANQPVELNVVTFAASGNSNASSSAAVNDGDVATDDEADEYFDSIFGGN